MNIGEEQEAIIVEPLEDPFERPLAPEPEREAPPVEEPERELVPA